MDTQPAFLNPELETRKFFWFMTAVLGGMAVLVAVSQPELQQPLRLAALALLMVVHIGLHWRVAWFAARPGGMPAYLAAQGLLAAGVVILTGALGLAFALAMALVGESIGVYGVTRRGLLASAYFLAVPLGAYTWVSSQSPYTWWSLTLIPMVVFVVIYVELYNRQANANARARELLDELEAANRQLSEYAAQVEDLTIVAERQRIARELHDTLSQGLAGLVLQLEAADAHLAAGRTERGHQIVRQTMDGARAALTGARRAIDTLRAAVPAAEAGKVSFEAALKAEVERFQAATGVEVSFSSSRGNAGGATDERSIDPSLRGGRSLPDPGSDPPGSDPQAISYSALKDAMAFTSEGERKPLTMTEGDQRSERSRSVSTQSTEHLLRIATEALNNIARHAQATQVDVRIAYLGDSIQLEIQDNGRGFDPASIPAGHYGLLGMRERARLAGGRLEVNSRPGAGTTVRARISQP